MDVRPYLKEERVKQSKDFGGHLLGELCAFVVVLGWACG